MGWSLQVFGETFREDQLTLDDFVDLEERLSTKDDPVTWGQIHPIRSAKCGKYVAARMYANRSGVSFDDAFTKVGQLGALDFIDNVDMVATIEEEPEPDPPVAGES